jgi:WD40 repeat protein
MSALGGGFSGSEDALQEAMLGWADEVLHGASLMEQREEQPPREVWRRRPDTLRGVIHTTVFRTAHGGGTRVAVASGLGKQVAIFDHPRGQVLHVLESGNFVFSLAGYRLPESGQARIAVGHGDGRVRVFDADTYELVHALNTTPGTATSRMCLYPDPETGRPRLVSGGGCGTVRVWEAETGELLLELEPLPESEHISALEVFTSGDGLPRLVASGRRGTVKVFNPGTQDSLTLEDSQRGTVHALACFERSSSAAAAGQWYIVGGGEGGATIWSADAGAVVARLRGHAQTVRSVAAYKEPVRDGDGEKDRVATASEDHTICLWCGETGERLRSLRGHTSPVTRIVAFEVEGRPVRLVSGSYDGTVRLWNLLDETPSPSPIVGRHAGWVTAMQLFDTLDGRRQLISGDRNGEAVVWDLGEVVRGAMLPSALKR